MSAGGGVAALLADHGDYLLRVAEAAIDHGLAHGRAPAIDPDACPEALRVERAAFVTLVDDRGGLRGCIGSIEAHRPLVADVSENAYAAAFRDPRFPPLAPAERAGLVCRLSVLTPPEPIAFRDEADLVNGLEPGRDGVLIVAGDHRGTLLPAVWDQIPDARDFWRTVKRKAGLGPDSFPAGMDVYRYRAETVG